MRAPTPPVAADDGEKASAVLFDVMVSQRPGWVTVAVIGELDLATSPRLRAAVLEAVAGATSPPHLVLDLGGVDFIDSTGLGVVLGAVRRIRASDGTISLVVRTPTVQRAFELTGLDQVLPIVATLDEAVAMATAARGGAGGSNDG